jgi:hypothetical protein
MAAFTLLQIVQEVFGRLGQPIPASVIGNTDTGVLQAKSLLNEFCDDLVTRKYWQANIREKTWAATATESQGTLSTLFPYGYEGIIKDTFFNRTQVLAVVGGLSPQEWQARKTMLFTGPLPAYRIRGGELLFSPVPVAGHIYALEYFSSYFVYNPTEDVYRQYWEKDTDISSVDGTLAMAYLTWAWRERKGLDYAESFNKYETLLGVKASRDDSPRSINMAGGPHNARPGILITPGSWPV